MRGQHLKIARQTAVIAALAVLSSSAAFGQLGWQTDIHAAHRASKASGRPMLVQFTAEWCHFCHKMKATTFADPNVQQMINDNFIPVMLDADQHEAMVQKLKLSGLPSTVMVGPDLRVWKKLNGFQNATKLQSEIAQTLKARQTVKSVAYARTRKPVVRQKNAPTPKTARRSVAATGRTSLPQVRPNTTPEQRPVAKPEVIRESPKRLAFDGICLVSLRDAKELKKGSTKFSTEYAGLNVSFASQSKLLRFRENPTKYWPKSNGACLVSASEGKRLMGQPQYGVMFRNQVWLFASAANMQRFVDSPEQFIQ